MKPWFFPQESPRIIVREVAKTPEQRGGKDQIVSLLTFNSLGCQEVLFGGGRCERFLE